MDRRSFVSLAGTAAAGALLAKESAAVAARRPNIVFVMADDLGYADLSCFGRREYSTPRIDSLARDGVRFTQAYSSSPVCSATRVALMTGRYQYRLRVGLEEPLRDNGTVGLPPEHPTLPSLLRAAGYRTALVGKWHLGQLPRFGPLQSGYDTFYGFRSGAVDYYSHVNVQGAKDLWDGDVSVDAHGYLTDLLGDRAVKLIEDFSAGPAPFLLSVHFSAPHWPWEAPGDEAEGRRIGSKLFHFDGGSMATYARMVERLDFQVGRVLDELAKRRLARDTLVVFTSDNGGERFSNTWPFSGRKAELLEGGVRVPALMRWPRKLAGGWVSQQTLITTDWMPTLLAAAGVTPHPEYPPDGVDLLPLLSPGAAPVARKLFWRYKSNAQRAMRDGDFKLLKIKGNTYLFNVVDDPQERANLRDRHRDLYARLTREWDAWNAAMLPEIPESMTSGHSAASTADRYGDPLPANEVDVLGWPEPVTQP